MTDLTLTIDGTAVEVKLGENTALAKQFADQVALGLDVVTAAMEEAAIVVQFLTAMGRYRSTIAAGVADFAVDQLFTSDEGGVFGIYRVTAGPSYTLIGSAAYTDEQVRDVIGTALTAGSGISVTANDGGNTITVALADDAVHAGSVQWNLRSAFGNANGYGTTAAGLSFAAAGTNSGSGGIGGSTYPASVPHGAKSSVSAAELAYFREGNFALVRKYGFRAQFAFKMPALGGANARWFVGFNTANPTNVDPSSVSNVIGVGMDAADSTLQFITNDASGSGAKVDTAFTPATGELYLLDIAQAAGAASLTMTLTKWAADTSRTAAATASSGTISADLPADTTSMAPVFFATNNDGGATATIGFANCRIWSA